MAVSYDGTWHHRGFKSCHGVGIVVSIDNREILDEVVRFVKHVNCHHTPKAQQNSSSDMRNKLVRENALEILMDPVEGWRQLLQKLSGLD